jgi:hypothetical protein
MTRLMLLMPVLLASQIGLADEPITIGSRRELFVDDSLVQRLDGRAELRLNPPTPREVALVTDEPW